jgi:hydrogenase nickel incorporation protein HypA/HybF
MHELSLALRILDISSEEIKKTEGRTALEMTLEVGVFSGVDASALGFALEMAARNTPFEHTRVNIQEKEGRGLCSGCGTEFPMKELYSVCPECGQPAQRIVQGEELRLVSLSLDG